MRALTAIICAIVLAALLAGVSGAGKDADGWVDLFPGKDLAGWKRVPIAPDTRPVAKNPWSVDAAARVLHCDGEGVKEMLLHETPRGDGVLRVTWRFRKDAKRKDYNAGVYVRTAADGKVWHQAQVAHPDKPPRLADLFGDTLVKGEVKKFLAEGKGTELANPPGEWNNYEVTCKGPRITVAVNGKVATTWDDCRVATGHVGLQAEYFYIEFKDLKFRPLP